MLFSKELDSEKHFEGNIVYITSVEPIVYGANESLDSQNDAAMAVSGPYFIITLQGLIPSYLVSNCDPADQFCGGCPPGCGQVGFSECGGNISFHFHL